jgi:hypothetical protein
LIAEIPYVLLISGVVLAGLWLSNILYDLGIPHYLSRKIGHSAGGVAFLLCGIFFSSAGWPIILAAAFTLLLWGARVLKPEAFRGVGGSGRNKRVWAEVWLTGHRVRAGGEVDGEERRHDVRDENKRSSGSVLCDHACAAFVVGNGYPLGDGGINVGAVFHGHLLRSFDAVHGREYGRQVLRSAGRERG